MAYDPHMSAFDSPGSLRIVDMFRRDVSGILLGSGTSICPLGTLAACVGNPHAQTPGRGGIINVSNSHASATKKFPSARGVSDSDWSRAKVSNNALAVLDEALIQFASVEETAPSGRAAMGNVKLLCDLRGRDARCEKKSRVSTNGIGGVA